MCYSDPVEFNGFFRLTASEEDAVISSGFEGKVGTVYALFVCFLVEVALLRHQLMLNILQRREQQI